MRDVMTDKRQTAQALAEGDPRVKQAMVSHDHVSTGEAAKNV